MKYTRLLVLCLIGLVCLPSLVRAQLNYRDTLKCGHRHSVFLGQTIQYGTIDDTVILSNKVTNDSTFSIKFLGDTSVFHFANGEKSIKIRQGESLAIPIHILVAQPFTPVMYLFLTATHHTDCADTTVFTYRGLLPTKADTVLTLGDANKPTIALRGQEDTTRLRIQFRNPADIPILVDSIYFGHNTSFQLDTTGIVYPIHLASHEVMGLRIRFVSKKAGVQQEALQVKTSVPPISTEFPVEALRLIIGGVAPTPIIKRTHLMLAIPNPAREYVSLSAPMLLHTHVAIFDLLGREVTQANFENAWTWNRSLESGGTALGGTYFVQVTGVTADGEQIREVDQIVLE